MVLKMQGVCLYQKFGKDGAMGSAELSGSDFKIFGARTVHQSGSTSR
jgi:hypothetical protein